MKKIIIWIVLCFLFVGSTWADVLIPWQEIPDYNEGCITQCMKETWESSALCKYSCVRWHEEYTEEIITSILVIPLFILFILFFALFYFLLSKFFWKQLKKNYQRALLFSVISLIITMSLIVFINISLNFLLYNI